jgi:hypothetical protein
MNSEFSYLYFSGANIKLFINNSELDAVGISYQVSYSKQPVYSYYSNKFDAVLEGKHIIQGRFVINFKKTIDIFSEIKTKGESLSTDEVPVDLSQVDFFDIEIKFQENKVLKLKSCFIMGHGQSIQIDDNVILTEYNFIGREIEHIEK